MDSIIAIVAMVIILMVTVHLADERGRNTVGWFIIAIFISFLAPLLLLMLGKTNELMIQELEAKINLSNMTFEKD